MNLQGNLLYDVDENAGLERVSAKIQHNSSRTPNVQEWPAKHNRSPLPIPELTEEQIERFWKRVDKRGPDECWLWLGGTSRSTAKSATRYGLWQSKISHGALRPHRVSFVLAYGPIPEGMTIDHVAARGCTSPLCCNPAHLEAVSGGENTLRYYQNLTQCKRGHEREPMSGICRRCAAMRARVRRAMRNASPQPQEAR